MMCFVQLMIAQEVYDATPDSLFAIPSSVSLSAARSSMSEAI